MSKQETIHLSAAERTWLRSTLLATPVFGFGAECVYALADLLKHADIDIHVSPAKAEEWRAFNRTRGGAR